MEKGDFKSYKELVENAPILLKYTTDKGQTILHVASNAVNSIVYIYTYGYLISKFMLYSQWESRDFFFPPMWRNVKKRSFYYRYYSMFSFLFESGVLADILCIKAFGIFEIYNNKGRGGAIKKE